jgi:hypothetical protein
MSTSVLMLTAALWLGVVTVSKIVKIRLMAVTSPAMIMTVVTAKVAVEQQVAAVKTAVTANMILPHMDLSAVIRHGMNMVLIVLP